MARGARSVKIEGVMTRAVPRLVVVAAGAIALIGVAVASFFFAVDRWHLSDRIVSGGRIRHCWSLGGTLAMDMNEMMRLEPGLHLWEFGRINDGGYDVVVAPIVHDDGTTLGYGAWILEHGMDMDVDRSGGAVNALARRVSGVDSNLDERDVRSQIRAARECSERGLP